MTPVTSLSAINTKNDAARYLDSKTDVSKTRPTTARLQREARVLVAEVKALEKSNRVPPRKLVSLLVRIARFSKNIMKFIAVGYVSYVTYQTSTTMLFAALGQIEMGLDAMFRLTDTATKIPAGPMYAKFGKTRAGRTLILGPMHFLIGATTLFVSLGMKSLTAHMLTSQFPNVQTMVKKKKKNASKTPVKSPPTTRTAK
jgi:hypothetical protein